MSYVIDFLDVNFISGQISEVLKAETEILLKQFDNENLDGWEVHFKINYGNRKPIAIYKKGPSIKSEKLKEITVHVPIPAVSEVSWGVQEKQYVNVAKPPNWEKNFSFLTADVNLYSNVSDYIIDSIRNAIKLCFQEGFKVNGYKIQG